MSALEDDQILEEYGAKEYEAGFVTDIETEVFPIGLDEDVVRAISKKKEEPEFMLEFRLKAFRRWKEMEEPDWAHLKYKKPEFQDISYYAAPKNMPKYNTGSRLGYYVLKWYHHHFSVSLYIMCLTHCNTLQF